MDSHFRGFVLDPTKITHSPAYMKMSLPARGAFLSLLLVGWNLPEVGFFPSDDELLAQYAGTDLETWLKVKSKVAPAFDTTQPGIWILDLLVEAKSGQIRYEQKKHDSAVKAGLASGEARRTKAERPFNERSADVEQIEGRIEGLKEGKKDLPVPNGTGNPEDHTFFQRDDVQKMVRELCLGGLRIGDAQAMARRKLS